MRHTARTFVTIATMALATTMLAQPYRSQLTSHEQQVEDLISKMTLEEKIGVDRRVSSFTIPLGATVNMDGTSIMQGVAVVFAAQAYGIDLGISGYLTVIATATLASIGTAGIPSVGLVTLSMVFASVGIPVEAIALIMGVDRILDMMRTAVNITGDAVVTTIVAHQNKSLDKAVFNSSEVKEDVPELTL